MNRVPSVTFRAAFAALFAARKLFPESENVRRNIPALAASMPLAQT